MALSKLGLKTVQILKGLKLEIVFFIYTFSLAVMSVSTTSMILDKVCRVELDFGEEVCSNLENYTSEKSESEKLAANYQLAYNLMQVLPSAVLAFFIGPWSDRYGRKMPTLIAISGLTLDAIGLIICSRSLNTSPKYMIIGATFTGLSGGMITCLSFYYSYASDISPTTERTMKYARMEISTGIASPVGVMVGGWVYGFLGYTGVFGLGLLSQCAHFAYILLLLPETRGLEIADPLKVKARQFFSCESFIESFDSVRMKRPNNGRRQIVMLVATMCFFTITNSSTSQVVYLYVHHQFDWDNVYFSNVAGVLTLCTVFFAMATVPILRRVKLRDPVLGILGAASTLVTYIGTGLAFKPWIYIAANIAGLLVILAPLAARSLISKLAGDDLGKIFSFVAIADTLFPMATSAMTTQIFNATLDVFPGACYVVLAAFDLLPLAVFVWISLLPPITGDDGNNIKEMQEDITLGVEIQHL